MPPFLMIHGAFCASWAMDTYRAFFEAEGVKVTAPTLRYHDTVPGMRAPQALGTTSLTDFVRDLEPIVRGFDEPPVIFGHSMGGLLAQMLAARAPVRALVLLAPSAPWGTLPTTPWELASAHSLYYAGQFWNRPLKPKQWIADTHALDFLPQAEREAVFARFIPESGLATFEIMHWPMDLRRASHVEARAVICPVLCIGAEHDRVNPPRTVASIAKRYRANGHFREVENHSHWLIGEPGWEETATYVKQWLKENGV